MTQRKRGIQEMHSIHCAKRRKVLQNVVQRVLIESIKARAMV